VSERELTARPENLCFTPARTALVINDMQNAFCSPGGYLERIGFSIADAPAVIRQIRLLCDAARRAGVTIVHLQNGFSADQHEAPVGAPIFRKSNALRYMRAHPEMAGKIITHGTWDYDFVDELRPQPGDLIVSKSRDSGFAGTSLDSDLRGRDIRTLLVCGIACNVGVESTIRAAYHLDYFAVLIRDATLPAGPKFISEATEHNVATFYGWVADTGGAIASLNNAT
jgi:ureidoacrylate peracid hydrolase